MRRTPTTVIVMLVLALSATTMGVTQTAKPAAAGAAPAAATPSVVAAARPGSAPGQLRAELAELLLLPQPQQGGGPRDSQAGAQDDPEHVGRATGARVGTRVGATAASGSRPGGSRTGAWRRRWLRGPEARRRRPGRGREEGRTGEAVEMAPPAGSARAATIPVPVHERAVQLRPAVPRLLPRTRRRPAREVLPVRQRRARQARDVVIQTSMNLTRWRYRGQWNQAQAMHSRAVYNDFM